MFICYLSGRFTGVVCCSGSMFPSLSKGACFLGFVVLLWLVACSRESVPLNKLVCTCLYILTCWFPVVFHFLSIQFLYLIKKKKERKVLSVKELSVIGLVSESRERCSPSPRSCSLKFLWPTNASDVSYTLLPPTLFPFLPARFQMAKNKRKPVATVQRPQGPLHVPVPSHTNQGGSLVLGLKLALGTLSGSVSHLPNP
jgi:hypothetical protein